MKLLKLIPLLLLLSVFTSFSFAETKDDCGSVLKANTGAKMYEKLKCKMGKEGDESLGNKLKNLFKKKNKS